MLRYDRLEIVVSEVESRSRWMRKSVSGLSTSCKGWASGRSQGDAAFPKDCPEGFGRSIPAGLHQEELPPRPVIGPVATITDEWLEQDATSPRKQRHTAHRIYERLKAKHGFTGAESTVRRYVRTHRRKGKESFVPLRFEPGEDAQADFGEAKVMIDGREVTISSLPSSSATHAAGLL